MGHYGAVKLFNGQALRLPVRSILLFATPPFLPSFLLASLLLSSHLMSFMSNVSIYLPFIFLSPFLLVSSLPFASLFCLICLMSHHLVETRQGEPNWHGQGQANGCLFLSLLLCFLLSPMMQIAADRVASEESADGPPDRDSGMGMVVLLCFAPACLHGHRPAWHGIINLTPCLPTPT